MDKVDYLVVGAGVSGLSFANAIREESAKKGAEMPSLLILEADSEPGGYCKTILKSGFTWDYSGHFFHFRHAEIEAWMRARMQGQDIRKVEKQTSIRFAGLDVDFPFQKNIHQLDKEDFIDCLVSLYFRDEGVDTSVPPSSFKDMLYRKFGAGISERFLIPYNEKLYACDLDELDTDAMGRFFPYADVEDVIRNMRKADNASYNSSFIYPLGGAIQFIYALLQDLPEDLISFQEALVSIDLDRKVAKTTKRELEFGQLVSSAPFDKLLRMASVEHDGGIFSWNKVLVFNLGFDRKGPENVHWMYFPEKETCFYRVGFYDNIMNTDRMSLYVELGAHKDDELDVEAMRARVLADLTKEGLVDGHELVDWHTVTMDPAYVHITQQSLSEHARLGAQLKGRGVHAVGRYGGWTYCSIEDNIVETRALAAELA